MLPAPLNGSIHPVFTNRQQAGRLLANELLEYAGTEAVVIALPRGGVVVGAEVARTLGATLDVWIARKLGVPGRPELGMGAIAEGPSVVLDRETIHRLGVRPDQILATGRRELQELRARAMLFRGLRQRRDLEGRTVIVVDDGIATGVTMKAAVRAIKLQHPARLIVAAPVAAASTAHELRALADVVVCMHEPHDLDAIGYWYEDFRQVRSEAVVRLLRDSR